MSSKCTNWLNVILASLTCLSLTSCLAESPIVEDHCGMGGLLYSKVSLSDMSGNNAKLFYYSTVISTAINDDESATLPQINSYDDLANRLVLQHGEYKELAIPEPKCSSSVAEGMTQTYYFVVAQENEQLDYFAGWPEQYQTLSTTVQEYGFMWVDSGGTSEIPANAQYPKSIEFRVSVSGDVSMIIE